MALATCKKCGEEISKKVKKCPKCGARLRKRTGCSIALSVLLLAIGLIWVLSDMMSGASGASSDRTTTEQVVTEEDWFASNTYIKALQDIPENMQNAQIILREGIVGDVGMTFKEFFLDRTPIMKCKIDRKDQKVSVEFSGKDDRGVGFTMTVNMTYKTSYDGTMLVDSVVMKQGWKVERMTSFNDKALAFSMLMQLYK